MARIADGLVWDFVNEIEGRYGRNDGDIDGCIGGRETEAQAQYHPAAHPQGEITGQAVWASGIPDN